MNQEFNYITNMYYRGDLTVYAESKEEADRILKDTLEGVDEKFRGLFENNNIVINDSELTKQFYINDKEIEKEAER